MDILSVALNAVVSLAIGLLIAIIHSYHNTASRNYLLTLASLPILVQMVIFMVNGNLGTGVAVMGAFSIIRFRSVAGGSREILSVFWAMAAGLATGTDNYVYAIIFSIVTAIFIIILENVRFSGIGQTGDRRVKITIAEDMDTPDLFNEILSQFSYEWELESVKTTQMGALYELRYRVKLKNLQDEKKLLDEIRVRNGNLPVSSGKISQNSDVL
jgi:uncharacterized membrane protein YhiD involved in acid resistance